MAYQVLARKWRPKTFDALVGQEHVVRALCNALDNQRLHHAYLLTGTRGVGKTTIARILGKALNCETGVTSTPCGVCEACLQIDVGRFVDLLEIDAASNTGIDNIREVLENAQYAPTSGRFKIYIIDEVHMLSKSAFNAMLKTLEEPPPHVKFILATTDPHKVPVTVLSRCLQFSLRQMTPQLISQHLSYVLDTETMQYEPAALALLSHAAAGSMRDALSLLDQAIAYGAGQIETQGIRAMLGAVDQHYIVELLYALQAQDGVAMMELVNTLHLKSVAFEAALSALLHVLHQVALAQAVPTAIEADMLHRQEILSLAQALSAEEVQLYYQIALHGRKDLSLATDEYAGFSMTLLRMLAFAPVDNVTKLSPLATALPPRVDIPPAESSPTISQETSSDFLIKPTLDSIPQTLLTASEPDLIKPSIAQEKGENEEKIAPDTLDMASPKAVWTLQNFQQQDWAALVDTLKGMSMMLAQNSALVSIEQNIFTLQVASKDKIVADRIYQDKLRADLSFYFNEAVILNVNIEKEVRNTPLIHKERVRDQMQIEAETLIQQDAFVQNVITEFGATIVPNSIKPIE